MKTWHSVKQYKTLQQRVDDLCLGNARCESPFVAGDEVLYASATDELMPATVVATHLDDPPDPYYTVNVGGVERATVGSRLCPAPRAGQQEEAGVDCAYGALGAEALQEPREAASESADDDRAPPEEERLCPAPRAGQQEEAGVDCAYGALGAEALQEPREAASESADDDRAPPEEERSELHRICTTFVSKATAASVEARRGVGGVDDETPRLCRRDVELAMPIDIFKNCGWMDPDGGVGTLGEAHASASFQFLVFDDERSRSPSGYEHGLASAPPTTPDSARVHRLQLYRYGLAHDEAASAVSVSSCSLQQQARPAGAPVFAHGRFVSMCDYSSVAMGPDGKPAGADGWQAWHKCNRYAIEVARTWWKLFDDMPAAVKNKVTEFSDAASDTMILAVTEQGADGVLYPGDVVVLENEDGAPQAPQLRNSMMWPVVTPSGARGSGVRKHNEETRGVLNALFAADLAADYDDLWRDTPVGLLELAPGGEEEDANKWQAWQVATGVFKNLVGCMPFWAAAHLHMGLVNDPELDVGARSESWGVPDVIWDPYANLQVRTESEVGGAVTWAHEQLHRCVLGFCASDGIPEYNCEAERGKPSAAMCYRQWHAASLLG